MQNKGDYSSLNANSMVQWQNQFESLKSELLGIKKLLQDREPPSNYSTEREILTAENTMKLLDISRNTFDRLRKAGKIKVYALNRRLYCKRSEILQALEDGLLNPNY